MHLHADLIDIAPVSYRSSILIEALANYDWTNAHEANLNDTRGIWIPFMHQTSMKFNWNHHKVSEKEKYIIELTRPFLEEIETHFNNHRFMKGEIYNCPAKSAQDLHIDPKILHRFCHRIHLPLITNDDSFLEIDGRRYHLEPYRIYDFNNMKPHGSYNLGDSARIHIVVDLMSERFISELSPYMIVADFFEDSDNPGTDLDAYIEELKISYN